MMRLVLTATALALGAACASGSPTTAGTGDSSSGSGGSGGQELDLTQLGAPDDPATCAAAAAQRSYLGCDFWPTVTANSVWSIFDFAVVVANIGSEPTQVSVQGPGGVAADVFVQPLDTAVIPLPWIPALKGPDSDSCGQSQGIEDSLSAPAGAYHLTSTTPIIVYQFNALQFRGAGGVPGKDWASCPGYQACGDSGQAVGCFSYSNDASILLPTTAMSGAYRVLAASGEGEQLFLAITATQDATTVQVELGPEASILAGGPVGASSPGGTVSFPMNAGDVVELMSDGTGDLAGTLILADRPVQVISGAPCSSQTDVDGASCDHLEESLQPAETLGKRYFVTTPTGPLGEPDLHDVRIVGNVDGTTLQYPNGTPAGAPATIDAGQVVDLPSITGDFEVLGDHEIAVASFLATAIVSNPDDLRGRGDPSQTQMVGVEQFRKSYVFLAPVDYDVNFADIVMPMTAEVTLDGEPLPTGPTAIGASGYGIARVRLGLGKAGAHSLSADQPVGVQVIGYGAYTSYQYPAGLDLEYIAPPPL